MTLSLGQMTVSTGDPAANLARARAMVVEAARRGSQLVLLPELWSTGYDLEHWRQYAAPLGSGHFADIATLAREHCIAVGGSLLETQGDHATNCFALFGPDGDLWGSYRKIHLFKLMDEDRWLAPGQEVVTAESPWGALGLAICYDLRFPELFRRQAVTGARLILLPAEWPTRRIAHWSTLLRARAIENQCFVAACNCVGGSETDTFGGRSAVIDAWGETIIEAGSSETLLTATIDLDLADRVRAHIPVLSDRRPELYA
jgi:predicted amidohydrolase